jgi:hypothetical protein
MGNAVARNGRRPRRFIVAVATWVYFAISISLAQSAESDEQEFYRDKIEPRLQSHCYTCHSSRSNPIQAGLNLDSRAGLFRGGDSGPAVVRGKSTASLLIQAIRHEGGLAMPLKQPKLPENVIADFAAWIEMLPASSADAEAHAESFPGLNQGRKHWAFQPVKHPNPPTVNNVSWAGSPVDAFILAKLVDKQWTPNRPADRKDWIRRITFDLIGLPPTPDEIREFVTEPAPDVDCRLVDRLMSDPRYGERASVQWLDVVRFAETEGYEYDRHIPDAWRYRDYVIRSLNDDKPFDRFLTEQLAGDEIEPDNPDCQVASIFHRLGPVRRNAGNPDIALSRNEVLTERTDIIGSAFLALTIGCARCHNHKLEPISQKDYYHFQAFLAATEEHNIILATDAEQRIWSEQTKRVKDEIDALRTQTKNASASDKQRIEEQIEALEANLPVPLATIPATWNVIEKRTAIHVLRRGIWENKGELVGGRPLSVLVPDDQSELPHDSPNPRTQLAGWLSNREHPLVARVIVNRLWQQHFGTGLVKTANDFGVNGDLPSHPELLDWIATQLIDSGWRLKWIHRQIVLSETYRQSSEIQGRGPQLEFDPENRLLWHVPRRRLSAEEVRDAMLSVSGRLNLKTGGPSVMVGVDPELVRLLYKPSQWSVTKDPAEHDRRSVYLLAKRNLRLPFLENFDAPALQTSCARRETSTHPPQALELLNGSLSNDLAESFASRLKQESDNRPDEIIDRAFQLALGRDPLPSERSLSREFLRDQPLQEFALTIFNLNGFLYVP